MTMDRRTALLRGLAGIGLALVGVPAIRLPEHAGTPAWPETQDWEMEARQAILGMRLPLGVERVYHGIVLVQGPVRSWRPEDGEPHEWTEDGEPLVRLPPHRAVVTQFSGEGPDGELLEAFSASDVGILKVSPRVAAVDALAAMESVAVAMRWPSPGIPRRVS